MRKLRIKRIIIVILAIVGLLLIIANCIKPEKNIKTVAAVVENNNSVTQSVPFTVHWDDKDYEETRPDSISYNLYKSSDPNTVIDTVTLNKADFEENAETWEGIFENVNLDNDNDFIIKEDNVENYLKKYVRRQNTIEISVNEVKGLSELFYQDEFGELKYIKLESDANIKIPNFSGKVFIRVDYTSNTNNGNRLSLNSIDSIEDEGNSYTIPDTLENMPSLEDLQTSSYSNDNISWFYNSGYYGEQDGKVFSLDVETYRENTETAKGCNQILNRGNLVKYTVTKIWDDEGHESERPNSANIKLCKNNDQNTVIETITMTSANAVDEYTWKTETNYFTKYDEEEKLIEYILIEDEIEGYISKYDTTAYGNDEMDMTSGIRIKFNPLSRIDERGHYYMKVYGVNTKTGEIYCTPGEFFKDSEFKTKNYELTFNNGNLERKNSISFSNNTNSTGGIIDLIGYNYPESRHPISVQDNYIWRYKVSPDSDIEWWFILPMESWGYSYGVKVDLIEPLGDNKTIVNTYNKQNINYTKVWEDEGYENLRTDKTIKLYADGVEVDSQTLRVGDYTGNEWESSFDNLPIYGDDFHKIEYRIEEVNIDDNYVTHYEDDYYNGLKVHFSKDSVWSGRSTVRIFTKNEDGRFIEINHLNNWDASYSYTDVEDNDEVKRYRTISDATVYIPSKDFYIYVSETANLIIDSIEPAHVTVYSNVNPISNPQSYFGSTAVEVIDEENFSIYLDGDWVSSQLWHYTYSDTNSFGANKIINKINKIEVTKKWKDEGFENSRPDSVSFTIKNANNPNTVLRTVELSEDDEIDSYTWKEDVIGLPYYNPDGSKAKYIIEETPDIGYITKYELPRKIVACKLELDVTGTSMEELKNNLNLYWKIDNENHYYYGRFNYSWDKVTDSLIIPNCSQDLSCDICFYVMSNTEFKIKSIEPIYETNSILPSDLNGGYVTVSDPEEIGSFPYTIATEDSGRYFHYVIDGTKPFIEDGTVSNAKSKRTVTVRKDWEDDSDRDGKRPRSITVNLFADGEQVDSASITATNNWTYVFEDLDRYNASGKEIEYTVTEDAITDYNTTIDGLKITNSYDYEKITINGTKIWDDNDNQDGKRPDEITIDLVDDGTVIETTTTNAEKNWSYSFENVPKYKNQGTEIEYVVSEHQVDEYNTTYDGFDITNSYTPEIIQVQGIKQWDDDDDRDGKRPEKVTVNLLADGVKVDSQDVTSENEWRFNFENLPKYKNGGTEIKYTLTEDKVAEYETEIDGYIITNKYTPEVVDINGTKTWEDDNNRDGKRPDKIKIYLYANDDIIDSKEVTKNDEWKYNFEKLPKYENHGTEIKYSIMEDEVEEYTTEIEGFNITNNYIPKTTSAEVTKKWEDDNNRDGLRPEKITVNLLADGEIFDTCEISKSNEWKYTFAKLPKYKDGGKEIIYTITEDEVSGYNTLIEGFDITNTHKIIKTRVNGSIKWDDVNNTSEIRPDKITLYLYGDDVLLDSIDVTADTDWTYSFENLPKYSNGKEIEYAVMGADAEKYKTTQNGFDFVEYYREDNGVKDVKAGDKIIGYVIILTIASVVFYIIKKKK